jgi:predicted PhzF superfamily epimerase YddE/YHI9
MASLHVLRVFTAPDGTLGNPLGVFLEGGEILGGGRQGVARELGFAETVFVDDPERGDVRIFAPEMEMPFAGHPSVGTAWLLREERSAVPALRMPAGEVAVRYEPHLTWIAARPEWAPPFAYVQSASPAEVDALGPSSDLRYCWAWEDEAAGRIRARSFVPDAGIAEDEATGSAALALGHRLGRAIQIRQGRGSDLYARPLDGGLAEVGGRVVLDDVREHRVPVG